MNKLVYDYSIGKWKCSKCGATYNGYEVARCFDYLNECVYPEDVKNIETNNIVFIPCHCMDCSCLWKKFEI